MMESVVLYYFTGTGNTKLIADTVCRTMEADGVSVRMVDMADGDSGGQFTEESGVTAGFVFPVYGLTLPRLVRSFMEKMPRVKREECFLIANAHSNSGKSRTVAKNILGRKGYRLIGSTSTFTPSSSIITEETEPAEKGAEMREKAVLWVRRFATDLTRNRASVESETLSMREWGVSLLFSAAMPRLLLNKTTVSENCRSCGLCARICPVGNITIAEGKPRWENRCQVCMRCINFCPSGAIEMMSSQGRTRYREPLFEKEIIGGGKK